MNYVVNIEFITCSKSLNELKTNQCLPLYLMFLILFDRNESVEVNHRYSQTTISLFIAESNAAVMGLYAAN